MKSTIWRFMGAISVFVALASPLRAQHYAVRNLGTLGGAQGSSAHSINDRGWVAGVANLTDDTVEHAALWRDGKVRLQEQPFLDSESGELLTEGLMVTDLGTLGGFNSNVDFPVKNNAGLIAGFAQISTVDPLGESFCYFICNPSGGPCQGSEPGSNQSCLAFVWRDGGMERLGTLGGNNSAALGANNRGLIVGTAENNTQDPACVPPQVLDYEAAVWRGNTIHELPPVPGSGDAIGAALAVNDNGQIAGGTGMCGSGPGMGPIFVHAVLWNQDSPIDLGGLGGAFNNVAYAVNNRGQVVGASDLAGDNTGHAFLWQKGVMTDLGTLAGDFSSAASAINDSGQAVGSSCDASGNCRAFLWQNGKMTDLNTLTSDSPLYLIGAADINSRGEIVGTGLNQNTGEPLAFAAIPCDQEHVVEQGCQDAAENAIGMERPKVVLPESVRKQLQHRMRFGR
jgi:probable HAF family extracellular repeat protein